MNAASEYLTVFNQLIKESEELYHGAAKQMGISEGTFWILYSLRYAQMPLTQKDLCHLLYQPKQTVNSAIKKMVSEGLVYLDDANGHRSKNLCLTEKGRRLAQQTVDLIRDAEIRAAEALTLDEQIRFLELFRKLETKFRENIAQIIPISLQSEGEKNDEEN